jgi:hypothetical protein
MLKEINFKGEVMKRLGLFTAVLSLFSAAVMADPLAYGKIPSATSSSVITIAASGADSRNCISDLTASSTSQVYVSVLSGSNAIYRVILSSNSTLVEDWNTYAPLCGDPNTALTIRARLNNVAAPDTGSSDTATPLSYSGLVLRR